MAFFRTKEKHKGRELAVHVSAPPSPEKAATPARSPTVFQNSAYCDQVTSVTPRRVETMPDARDCGGVTPGGPFRSKKTSLIDDSSLRHQQSLGYLKTSVDVQNPDIEVID